MTAEGKEIKNLPEIRRLLEAVQLPHALSIVHVPGHQKGDSPTARGNRAADLVARKAANEDFITPVLVIGLPPPGMGTLPQPLSIHPQTLPGSRNIPTSNKERMDGTETLIVT